MASVYQRTISCTKERTGRAMGVRCRAASWGTPDKILRGLEERRKIIGDFELNVAFRFGGTPYEVAERGLKLFAKEVLPVLKSLSPIKVREAAE
jgi:hypothetical protein